MGGWEPEAVSVLRQALGSVSGAGWYASAPCRLPQARAGLRPLPALGRTRGGSGPFVSLGFHVSPAFAGIFPNRGWLRLNSASARSACRVGKRSSLVEDIRLKQKCARFPIGEINFPHIASVFHFVILDFYQDLIRNFWKLPQTEHNLKTYFHQVSASPVGRIML